MRTVTFAVLMLLLLKAPTRQTPVPVGLQQPVPIASGQTPGTENASAITKNPPIIQTLAGRMAQSVEKSKTKRILVFDFVGPDADTTQWMPGPGPKGGPKPLRSEVVTMLGRSLANEFSTALGQAVPSIDVRTWNEFYQTLTPDNFMPTVVEDPTTAWWAAKAAKFDLFVWGHFELDPDYRLNLSVVGYREGDGRSIEGLKVAIGLGPSAKELASIIVSRFESRDPVAGKDGTTVPSCLSCPRPSFPEAAIGHAAEGSVLLEAIITADGYVKGIKVQRGLPYGFTESAIEAVERWRFEPPLGPDGKPTDVRHTIMVIFNLRRTQKY